MKKIGLLCLAIVLALGTMGAGFAYWNETLTIEDTNLNTGDVDAIFRQGVSNDDGSVTPHFCIDGKWWVNVDRGDNGSDPTAEQTMCQPVNRTLAVASTTVTGEWPSPDAHLPKDPPVPPSDYKTLTVTMTNAYPSYHPTIFFNVINAGSIPCRVKAVKLVEVSVGNQEKTVNQELVVCTTYYVDAETGTITLSANADSDFSIHLSDDAGKLFQTYLKVWPEWPGTASGNLDIHVENGAEESTTYDFTIKIVVTQFNAP